MGGRAREFVVFGEDRTVGGVMGPRVSDVPRTLQNSKQRFTTQREASIPKSDVWRYVKSSFVSIYYCYYYFITQLRHFEARKYHISYYLTVSVRM